MVVNSGTLRYVKEQSGTNPARSDEVDLNQVVAYNVREARELRGWTQDDFSARLEPYMGQRLTQAGVSSIERAWDGDRKREFDAHELLIFSLVFDLPILWFLLPPPGDDRLMRATTRPVNELYAHLLGMPHQLDALYDKLRRLGVADPDGTDPALQRLTGAPNPRQWGYRQQREALLLALENQHADDFDTAVEELGAIFDHLRQVGMRGFIAEKTYRERASVGPGADEATPTDTTAAAEALPAGTGAARPSTRRTGRRR